MRILITGSSGFLGSNLYTFLNKEYNVFGIDIIKSDTCDYVYDLTKVSQKLQDIIKDSDLVIHLASSVGVLTLKNPSEFFNNSFKIDNNILKICSSLKKKIIFTSTSEVYGEVNFGNEESDFGPFLNNIRSCYPIQKLQSEFFIKNNFSDYIILRPFNIIGKNQHKDKSIITRMFNEGMENKNITVYYDKDFKHSARDFCNVKDFCEYVYRLIKKNSNGIYNVGNHQTYTSLEVADIVKNYIFDNFGEDVKISEKLWEFEFNDILYRTGDFSKIQKETSYLPKYTLKYSLNDYVQRNLNNF